MKHKSRNQRSTMIAMGISTAATLLAVTVNLATEWKTNPLAWAGVMFLTLIVTLLSIRVKGQSGPDSPISSRDKQARDHTHDPTIGDECEPGLLSKHAQSPGSKGIQIGNNNFQNNSFS